MKEFDHKNNNVPRVIAIASGKGGVGKTFIAVNLASALSRCGKKVVLLDGDFGLANIHLLLGEKSEQDLEAVLAGKCELEEILLPTAEGFTIIPGGRGKPLMADLQPYQLSGLISAVDTLSSLPDIFLIDTAGSISMQELQLISAAGEIIIVITPDKLALQDAAEYIRQLHIGHSVQRFFIVSNMTKSHREAHNLLERLQNLVGFDVDVVLKPLGSVSSEESAKKSMACMSSVLESDPDSKVAKQINAITGKLNGDRVHSLKSGGLSFFYEQNMRAGDA